MEERKKLRKKEEIVYFIIIGILIFTTTVALSAYGFQFKVLSHSQVDWAYFGDYLSGVFGLFNLLFFVLIAYYARSLDLRRDDRLREIQLEKIQQQQTDDIAKEEQTQRLNEQRNFLQIQTQKKNLIRAVQE